MTDYRPAPLRTKVLIWSVAALFQVMSGTLQADSPDEEELAGWNPVTMRLGMYLLEADSTFGLKKDGGGIELVNLNRLGVKKDDTSPWISGVWRFGRKWSLFLSAFRYDEDGFGVWEIDFDFGDITFPAGAQSYARLATDFYLVDTAYTLIRTPQHELLLGFGIYGVDIKAEFEARVNEIEINNKRFDFLAPLPNGIVKYSWKISDHWAWHSSLGWFGLSYDKYSGSLINFSTSFEYSFNDHWGMGLGYSAVDMDLEIQDGELTEIYDINIGGVFAYLSLQF